MAADLTPYVPRLVLEWDAAYGEARHARLEGTLVFADVSGFTRLSERLAQAGGRLGAEQLTEVIDGIFDQLLTVAVGRGGEMLKYGGDAVLLLFRGNEHTARAVAASMDMQTRLREIGRVDTGAGAVRMRMSVGVHTGQFDMFLVGRGHRELVVAGPHTTRTIEIEAQAEATEVLVSQETADVLEGALLGPPRGGARLVRRPPPAPTRAPVRRGVEERAAEFLPPPLQKHLVEGAVHAEHRLVTQAFVHVAGLDGLLDRAGPTAAADALDRTMTAIQDACVRYGVTFLASDIAPDGVKVIVVAGAPEAVEEPEARMAAAMEAIRDAGCPLPVRVGINCGHVFAGDVGPHFRRTYTTIGDVTNTAARVMARAEPGEVLTLDRVADTLRAMYLFEELSPFEAKGKAEPLVPYRMGPPRSEAQASDEDEGDATPMPFTGRDEEADRLRGALGGGPGAVVDLVGEVGIGKSRLADEVLESLDLPVRRLACEPYESSTPYYVIGRLIRAVLGSDTVTSGDGLLAVVSDRCPDLTKWAPLLAAVLDVEMEDTPETASLDPQFVRRQTAMVIERLLAALLTEPWVLYFEDVHWADESSSDVLTHLEQVAGDRPWSVLLTRRDRAGGHVPSAAGVVSVVLEPLDDGTAKELVDAATAADRLHPHRVAEIVRRSAGNPLFIEGLLRVTDLDDDEQLPDSIEAVVAADIDRLTSTGRRLLRLASVHGNAFELSQLVVTARQDGIDLPLRTASEVARFVGGSLVAEGRDRLRFRHHVLRDVAYIGLPYRQRRTFHGHAADALADEIGDISADDRVGLLSLHEWHAGRYEHCWEHSRVAGARAAGKHAHVEATAALRRALSAAGQLGVAAVDPDELSDVWERLGDAAVMIGEGARASANYKQARRKTTSPAVLARLCGKEARIAEMSGGRARARRWLRRGLAIVDESDEPEAGEVRATLLARSAWTAAEDGKHEVAVGLARRAIEEGLQHGNVEAAGYGYVVFDGSELALGNPDAADHTADALSLFEAAGAIAAKANALNNLGAQAYYRGSWPEARRLYDEARAANVAAGNVVEAGGQIYNAAEILVDQGLLDDAVPMLEELEDLWGSVRYDVGLVFAAGLAGILELRRGRPSEALDLLEPTRRRLHDAGLRIQALAFDLAAVDAQLLAGGLAEAAHDIESLRRASAVAAVPGLDAHLLRSEGSLRCRQGAHAEGRAMVTESVAAARRSGSLFQVVLGLAELRNMGGHALDEAEVRELDELTRRLGIVRYPPSMVRMVTTSR